MNTETSHPPSSSPSDALPGGARPRRRLDRAWTFEDPASHRAVVREVEAIQWTAQRVTRDYGRARSVDGRRSSMWLAAYALGLAHTASSADTCARELLGAAEGCDVLLHEARNHLASLTTMDADLRDRAGRLLTVAALQGGGSGQNHLHRGRGTNQRRVAGPVQRSRTSSDSASRISPSP